MADYNKLLYEKVRVEYERFIEALKKMTPEQVIEKAYEKAIKEDMVTEIQQCNLTQEEANALYLEKYPLDLMYQEWLDTDVSFMGLLRDSIDDTAKKAVSELRKEHRTVTKPGAIMEYEGINYSVGSWIIVRECSEYAGLTGVIVEMSDEEGDLDITCNLIPPKNPEEIAKLEAHFSKIYGEPKALNDIPLDMVILAPDEIQCMTEKPVCYDPEPDNPYPLCVGNGSHECEHCAYYVHLDLNRYE